MAVKDIHKTIRLDQSVVDYIMSFDGNTFSQCFDSMIYQFRDMDSEIKDRTKAQLKYLDRQRSRLDRIDNKLQRLDSVTYELFQLDNYVQRIRSDLDNISRDP